MKRKTLLTTKVRLAVVGIAISAGLFATACSDSSDYVYIDPASTEEVGTDLWEVTLTERAAQRTGIETVEVSMRTVEGAERLTIPYSAVMYHYDGTEWTYTVPSPLTYLRAAIEIDYIDGDLAVLNSGPNEGTEVVSVGAAELYGVEFGIGK